MKSYFDNQPFVNIPEMENVPNAQKQPGSPTLSAGAPLIGAVCTLGSPDLQGLGESDNTWRQLGNSGVDREIRSLVDAGKYPLNAPNWERENFEENDAEGAEEVEPAERVASALLGGQKSDPLGGPKGDPLAGAEEKAVGTLKTGLGAAEGIVGTAARLMSPDRRRK